MGKLSQRERVISLGIDLVILLTICLLAFGTLYPPLGDKGFWFYTALLSILVGSKIVTPFYVKPVDAISYSVPAFVALMLVNKWGEWPTETKTSFVAVSLISISVLASALVAVVLNNWGNEKLQSISNKIRIVLEIIGKPQVIYTPIIFFSMYAYHSDAGTEIILISLALLTTVVISVGDIIIKVYKRIISKTEVGRNIASVATVAAFQQPYIALLRQSTDSELPLKSLVYIKDKHSKSKLALTLDLVGRDEGVLVRAVEVKNLPTNKYVEIESLVDSGSVAILSDSYLSKICKSESIDINDHKNVVGIVAPDSSIERLFFEVVDNESLEEGRMVSVKVQNKKVLYQIVGGYTKEEVVHQKNTYGYLKAQAQQIGVWNEAERKFEQFSWLPSLNDPVYIEEQVNYQIQPDTIGHFPDSNYQVKIGNINHLVTHNTAILGILGVGKSMLAIELLERMMSQGIKVICLDLTNQYANELADYYNHSYEQQCLQRLQTATDQDRDAWNENPEQGGSVPNLKNAFYEDLNDFINGDHNHVLKIYNPAQFVATRQDRVPTSFQANGNWQRGAALFSVTPVEITQIVSEVDLEILSAEMSDTAKVCLVYEEAHSLVPEWNSVVADGDKHATSGTARAILQGRKFGLGCMLITQRTANVTKTILNQCNTIFAMRTFDDTGKDFLGNHIGKDYAETLSSIKERHAVFFGRGSSCENPVLIKVNDRADFLRSYRAANPVPSFPEPQNEVPVSFMGGQGSDIPF